MHQPAVIASDSVVISSFVCFSRTVPVNLAIFRESFAGQALEIKNTREGKEKEF
ncbi:hypothetical protein EV210_10356 [Anaerospora hongkongensis]|uniref:Uncharacterized protein n=1 Tax=Anaerospora hongkongensis TaxID=244830 RepID=A0A4R1Q0Z7_9FIRM|nr:hypothetical protein [Anaerospora hongkongensis]TCL38584.1 hypothetical protein EV210_10356 [Anaerospora hongkongensis]